MAEIATSNKWVEFYGTILGAFALAVLIPDNDGPLVFMIAIGLALYRLARTPRQK